MRTLIIPDVHLKIDRAEWIVSRVPHDHVVWLGDFFDDFGDTLDMARDTAKWLARRMDQADHETFLLGNHDAPYMWGLRELECSGYHPKKAHAIHAVMPPTVYRERFKLNHMVEGWIMSHAGMHVSVFSNITMDVHPLILHAYHLLHEGVVSPVLRAGWARGGIQAVGGVTWLDWNHEFQPIAGVNQIVGHTPGKTVRSRVTTDSKNYCLDTHLNHYGLIEDGKFSYYEVP